MLSLVKIDVKNANKWFKINHQEKLKPWIKVDLTCEIQ